MLDEDNYPDEVSLEQIKNWDIFKQGLDGIFLLIEENTNWADRQIHKVFKKKLDWGGKHYRKFLSYEYHTGGWSGNEDVINSLQQNFFWFLFWERSIRGGHYYFEIEHPEWYPLVERKE